ncbi:hypothetical protein LG329_07885 [Virgibacillus necropolis]
MFGLRERDIELIKNALGNFEDIEQAYILQPIYRLTICRIRSTKPSI